MKQKYTLIFTVCLFAVITSCFKKETFEELSSIKGVQSTADFSAPLLTSSLTLRDLYESYSQNALIRENPDNLLVFVYRSQNTVPSGKLLDQMGNSSSFELQLPDPIADAFNMGLIDEFSMPAIDNVVTIPTPDGEKIKKINLKEGSFDLSFVSTYKHNIRITLEYPSITKNGAPLSKVIDVNYTGVSPQEVVVPIDLKDYDIDFTDNNTTSNTLRFEVAIKFTRIPGNIVSPQDKLTIEQDFKIRGYNSIEGYLGRKIILEASQETEIDLFQNSLAGQVFINDPRLVITARNTYGVPVTARVSNLRVVDMFEHDFPVTIDQFADTFTFDMPAAPGRQGVSKFTIDKDNSNIDSVINTRPKFIRFDLKFETNYREDSSITNFILDTAMFAVDIDAEVPIDLKVINYVVEDKSSNRSFGNLPENVQEVKLNVVTENTLPFDLTTQMLFTRDSITFGGDTINIPVDSLFSIPLFIPGGIVDANGEMVAPKIKQNTITLTADRYKRIQSAPNNILRMIANTAQFNGAPGFVKVKTNLRLNMRIGSDIKFTYKSK